MHTKAGKTQSQSYFINEGTGVNARRKGSFELRREAGGIGLANLRNNSSLEPVPEGAGMLSSGLIDGRELRQGPGGDE